MTTPLLEAHRRCHSGDPERAQAYLDTVGFCVEPLKDDDTRFDMRVNGVYLPIMFIGYTQYGPRLSVPITGSCCRCMAASKRACARTPSIAIRGGAC